MTIEYANSFITALIISDILLLRICNSSEVYYPDFIQEEEIITFSMKIPCDTESLEIQVRNVSDQEIQLNRITVTLNEVSNH